MKRLLTLLTLGWLTTMTTNAAECPKVLMTTNFGDIEIELFCEEAPKTTENFISYVNSGFYDGTIFHRIIPGFMVQGGGFEPGLVQKQPNAPIENEANNGLKNLTGTLSMARTSDPNSATAQFFINVNDNDFLNYKSPTPQGWGYAVFGKVTEGLDNVMKMSKTATKSAGMHQDVPASDVIIESAKVISE